MSDEMKIHETKIHETKADETKADETKADGMRSRDPKSADPAVSVVGPDDGELVVLGSTRMRILEDGSNTGHRIGFSESVIAPHTPGPPQHRHAQHDEGFYVISGTVRFTVGAKDYDAPAGTLVMVPPGAPHTFGNHTDQPAVMLTTFTPDLYVQYFRDLESMIAGGQAMTLEATVRTMSRYATDPATDFIDLPEEQHHVGHP